MDGLFQGASGVETGGTGVGMGRRFSSGGGFVNFRPLCFDKLEVGTHVNIPALGIYGWTLAESGPNVSEVSWVTEVVLGLKVVMDARVPVVVHIVGNDFFGKVAFCNEISTKVTNLKFDKRRVS